MKKTGLICRILCCMLALVLMAHPVAASSTETDMSIEQGCRTIEGKVPLIDPLEDLDEVSAAFLYDITNDTVLYAANPDEPCYPAGLVKIMTALLVAERGNMDDQITVRQEVLDACYGSFGIDLQDGEIISVQDLMYGILVEGANVAAVVAADYISGSQEAFVQEMNAYAKELGCTGTNFVNVHGLHDDEQVTTARDVAKILTVAIKNEAFWEPFSTYGYKTSATNLSEERRFYSGSYIFNRDLGSNHYDSRVTGCRMGETIDGGRNLAVTATVNDVELLSIVLESVSEVTPDGNHGFYKEVRILMDKGFNGCYPTQILYENQVLKQFEVKNGDSYVSTGVKDTILTVLPNGTDNDDLTYLYSEENTGLQAPIQAGDVVSTVQIWYHDVCLAQADLYALHNVGVMEVIATEEIKADRETSAFTVLIVVAVIVGLLVILLFGRGLIFRVIHKQQIRRQRKNRRRSR